MNKNDEQPSQTRYQQDLQAEKEQGHLDDSKGYIEENGKRFRLPYGMIREAVFSNVDEASMVDQQHAARLQYRLLLKDPIIKAYVEFSKGKITVIYNPKGADNIREKISLDELISFFEGEGVRVDRNSVTEREYDYYKEFYSYAFSPKRIREHPPYGYTEAQWKKMKPDWEKKVVKYEKVKLDKFREYQKEYEKQHPEVFASKN